MRGAEKIVEAWQAGKRKRVGNGETDGVTIWLYGHAIAARGTVLNGRKIEALPPGQGDIFVRCPVHSDTTVRWLNDIPGVSCGTGPDGHFRLNGRRWDGEWRVVRPGPRPLDAVPHTVQALEGLAGVRVERWTAALFGYESIAWPSPEAKVEAEKEAVVFIESPTGKLKHEVRQRCKAAGLTVQAPRHQPDRMYVTLLEPAHIMRPMKNQGGGPKYLGVECSCGWSERHNGATKRTLERYFNAHVKQTEG